MIHNIEIHNIESLKVEMNVKSFCWRCVFGVQPNITF